MTKKVKESQTQTGVNVRWEYSMKAKRLAYFVFASKEDFDSNLLPGNELRLRAKLANGGEWSARGHVARLSGNDEVVLELNTKDVPVNPPGGFSVEFVWKSTSFTRMRKGLYRFWHDEDSLSVYLYYSILGIPCESQRLDHEEPKVCSAPGLPQLNVYQVEAVKKALTAPLCLIQGPPGTGKTITSASIVYHIVQSLRKRGKPGQVLVCAPSNIVVDQLAEKINFTGVKVVRVCSKAREAVSSSVEPLTLHSQVRKLDVPEFEDLMMLFRLTEEQGSLSHKDEEQFKKLLDRAENVILEAADVICTTCVTAADPRLRDFRFHQVLIDEATQAVEPESMLPLLKGAKHAILVGDHRQLGPVVACREAARAGLNKSLFERFVALGVRPLRLQVQYRMHPELSVFPSNTFYEGTLQNGVTMSDRHVEVLEFPWPNKNKPMFFWNSLGVEEISASGTSYLNKTEAKNVEKTVFFLIRAGVKPNQIGIITPYKGQRAFILNYMGKSGVISSAIVRDIEIASVDGFQGREKDYIIISCVRSNEGLGIGFLNDPRRLNVTITRAKYGLVVIGNARVLSRDPLWNNMLNHFKEAGLLVEGELASLKQCGFKLRPPKKYIAERQPGPGDDMDDAKSTFSALRHATETVNNFETLSQVSFTRRSEFGFSSLPRAQQFEDFRRAPPAVQNVPSPQGQKPAPTTEENRQPEIDNMGTMAMTNYDDI
eukprot:TRINITY_DN6256_c0_g1_i1.p1 TRINITY_DN6256_c0_g1~~TRINITY_DN6256_c0_g1_i1.p1  ORF type:complete len:714 (+),score=172.44 TRINITY_DN6256_c0_g1_i1:912-3053(+)